MKIVVTAFLIVVIWGLPLLALVENQRAPSYGNALGVAYAWVIGLALGFVIAPLVGIAATRWPRLRFNIYLVALAWLALFALLPLANSGGLSRVH